MDVLACPNDHQALELKVSKEVNGTVEEGTLSCLTCNKEFQIKNGIPMLFCNEEQTVIEKWWELSDAPLVDHMFMRGIDPHDQPIRCRIRDEVVANGNSALDVGCATCIDYPLYREAGLHYVGVDFTYKLLLGARKHMSDVPVVQGDGKKLPFKDESFDSVYVKDVLVHLPPGDYKKVLTDMWRVTKKVLMVACGISADTVKECRYSVTEIRPDVGYKYASQSSSYTKASLVDALSNLPRFGCLRTNDVKIEGDSSSGYRTLFVARKKTEMS